MLETLDSIAHFLATLLQTYPKLSVFITAYGVFATYQTNKKNRQFSLFGSVIPVIVDLDRIWEGEDLRKHRKLAAGALLRLSMPLSGQIVAQTSSSPQALTDLEDDAVVAVLNFFETLGLLQTTGALKPRTTWQLFGAKGVAYWEAARLCKLTNPTEDDTIYTEARFFYRTCRIEELRDAYPGYFASLPIFESVDRFIKFTRAKAAMPGSNPIKALFSKNVELQWLAQTSAADEIRKGLVRDTRLS